MAIPSEQIPDADPFVPPGQILQFITQTGSKATDRSVLRKVRQHARSYVSKSKGAEKRAPLLKFNLVVPESFGSSSSSGCSTPDSSSACSKGIEGANFLDQSENLEVPVSSRFPYETSGRADVIDYEQSQCSSSLSSPYHHVPQTDIECQQTSDPQVKAKARIQRTRIRTGCRTCKARRLKCDEAKPACRYCLDASKECPGYSKTLVPPSSTRALALKKSTSDIVSYQPSSSLPFENNTEALYFKVFREETAVELSGVFASSFWNQVLLQEAHHRPFVRQALVAIAALNKSVKTSQLAKLHPGSKATSHKQREYALSLYGKSLRGMQLIPQSESRHVRELVIAILLVFVFETIHQQPDIAFSHALIGDRLMCHFVETTPHPVPQNDGISSPATHIIESELLMTFCRFDTQMITFVDVRSQYVHNMGKRLSRSTVKEMPASFGSLREATLYWEVVMRRTGHFIHSTSAINGSAVFAREFSHSFPGKTLEINAQTSIYGSPYIVPDSLRLEQLRFVSDIDRWTAAFDPLSQRLQQNPEDIQTTTAITILRLYSLTLKIIVIGTTFTEETKYDQFLPQFREMVSLSRIISRNLLEITHQQPAYHFHLSIVPPLFTLLLRCRDKTLRREAVDILRTSRYDGPWDRFMIAAVGKWIMEVEEEGERDGVIPEESRVRLSRMSMSMEGRGVVIQCVRRGRDDQLGGELGLEWVETKLSGPWV
ncbi:uncharacterized protein LY89DRAFT_768864 [Mollisia scopiformis]|uniref:Zn(2)-C6 fungal-type domain-containing protein n=1 Tax=Mollisia scopiformis TaxID=149040 RepID=A0A132B3L3_MOLSC|nr:uncharacterized protein LY89DRAFT_768864 [Mollisia scopiformis]KUJ06629.1 hypothetical protein LY89DRAFT_768864 [Mollisia scopiformis]